MSDTTVRLQIRLLSYWHAGSGLGRGAEADALVLRDRQGLPYLPGRSVKGLLREGLQACEDAGQISDGKTCELFGKPTSAGRPNASVPGLLGFSDARLPENERKWLARPEAASCRACLYDTFASTRLDKHGLADDHTLRTIELCIPLELTGTIFGPTGSWTVELQKACRLVRTLGSHRHRGLGRCELRIVEGGQ